MSIEIGSRSCYYYISGSCYDSLALLAKELELPTETLEQAIIRIMKEHGDVCFQIKYFEKPLVEFENKALENYFDSQKNEREIEESNKQEIAKLLAFSGNANFKAYLKFNYENHGVVRTILLLREAFKDVHGYSTTLLQTKQAVDILSSTENWQKCKSPSREPLQKSSKGV